MVVTEFLSTDEVLAIHRRVCLDFAQTDDPVGWEGPRDKGLLESAVSRQHVGLGNVLKHPDPLSNAATLAFGLCCGHPFHNGNKRTALVAMLAHLDKNQLSVFGIRQKELYDMILRVATHSLGIRVPARRRKRMDYTRREADAEVAAIRDWLEKNARKVERGERRITYRQLRQILGKFGYQMDHPRNNSIGIYRVEQVKRGLLRNKTVNQQKRIAAIGYPGENKVMGVKSIKQVRRLCRLDEANGCDTASFYEGADVIDVFINEYRGVLRKLSKE